MHLRLFAAACLITLACAFGSPADAEPIQFSFNGTVQLGAFPPAINAGDPVTGTFWLDPFAPDNDPSARSGRFSTLGPFLLFVEGFNIAAGATELIQTNIGGSLALPIELFAGFSDATTTIPGAVSATGYVWWLDQTSTNANSVDTNVAAWLPLGFEVSLLSDDGSRIGGFAGSVSGIRSVPEPTTLSMTALGMLMLGARRFRRSK
jgi:hypothetical protein